jgi:hypothetical protein
VTWEMVQLGQPLWGRATVRDLWAQEQLGSFAGSFTFKGLEPHATAFLIVAEEA